VTWSVFVLTVSIVIIVLHLLSTLHDFEDFLDLRQLATFSANNLVCSANMFYGYLCFQKSSHLIFDFHAAATINCDTENSLFGMHNFRSEYSSVD